ncbi:MAG TPA: hypothetical protein PKD61_13855 [Polyangiaceae bacterium]|nr:hypothetical protein [Polyangiaceae bacterium]
MMAFRVLLAPCVVFCVGCGLLEPPPTPSFESRIKVFGDPDQPLKDAKIMYKKKEVGVTDADGLVNLRLKGSEGQVINLNVQCPDGFTSPSEPVSVALRRIADKSVKPMFRVDCPPSRRNIVVAVRADNGPNLPVKYLGREIARTDESGAAHVYLSVAPNQQIQMQLATDGDDAKDLRPQSPVLAFEVKSRDEVFVIDQKFKVERKRRYYSRPKKASGPTPL